jgi:rod shape-determining protein MreD
VSVNGRLAVVLLAGWIAQAAIVPFISFGGIQPDIILIIICLFGFFGGPVPGAVAGLAGGLLHDLLVPGNLGLGMLAKTLTGYLSGQVERTILGNATLMPMLVVGALSILSQIIYLGLAFLMGQQIELIVAMRAVVLPSALYTALLGLFFFTFIGPLLSPERQATVFK